MVFLRQYNKRIAVGGNLNNHWRTRDVLMCMNGKYVCVFASDFYKN